MIEWALVICTAGWGLCGHFREERYQTEESCYRALNDLYNRKGADYFKYLICAPRKPKDADHKSTP